MTNRFNDSLWDHQREHRSATKLEEARLEVQRRLRRERPAAAAPEPRYDEEYFDGLNWLASLS